eukprot:1194433-Prorocentrum_minimum.AAC.4
MRRCIRDPAYGTQGQPTTAKWCGQRNNPERGKKPGQTYACQSTVISLPRSCTEDEAERAPLREHCHRVFSWQENDPTVWRNAICKKRSHFLPQQAWVRSRYLTCAPDLGASMTGRTEAC